MRTRLLVTVLALAGAVSCSPRSEPVELAYRFSEDRPSRYTLEASARADWDFGGGGTGSYQALYSVLEEVESNDESGAVIRVTMRSRWIREDNLPAPARGRTSFRLRLGRDGSVLEVLEVQGAPVRELTADELVFIGTFRPPLPARAVRPGAEWEAASGGELGAVFRRIVTRGTLEEVERTPSTTLAALSFAGGAPLVWTTSLGEARAQMSGSADTEARAIFDVDQGRLNQATSSTAGSFTVRVLPGAGQGPLSGRLDLQLELDLRRVGWRTVRSRLLAG